MKLRARAVPAAAILLLAAESAAALEAQRERVARVVRFSCLAASRAELKSKLMRQVLCPTLVEHPHDS